MNNSAIFETLFFFLAISSVFLNINAESQLKFLSVVFRHGDRAPDNNGNEGYPNDPYKDFDFAPEGHGGLTNNGKRREYALGKELRELYGDFIGDSYSPIKVNARSTDYDRTKMSLQLVMSALFKPKKDQIWNSELNWQPTVANFVPGFLDVMMVPEECYQYLEEFARVKELPEVKARLNKLSGFMKNLTQWTGKPITASVNMFDLYHTLMAEYARNLTLPEWTNGIFPYGLLWNGTILEYDTVSYNTKLKRLNGGMLLRNITKSMLDVTHNRIKNGRKINLFSGHETNVAALLQTLGVYTPHVPEYSSAVLVELLGDSEGDYVRVRYYKGIPAETIVMKIPGCDELCPFERYRELMKPVIPRDSELICQKEAVWSLSQKIYNKFSRVA